MFASFVVELTGGSAIFKGVRSVFKNYDLK
jgi:hypothetical protein